MWTDECLDLLSLQLSLDLIEVLSEFSIQFRGFITQNLRLSVYHSPA